MDQNGDGIGHFQAKSRLTNFQKLIHQISLLADFTHFEQPFHYKTQKLPIIRHLSLFPTHLKFQENLAEGSLKTKMSKFLLIINYYTCIHIFQLFQSLDK